MSPSLRQSSVCLFLYIFFSDTATTEIYTLHIVGSVRCVQETALGQSSGTASDSFSRSSLFSVGSSFFGSFLPERTTFSANSLINLSSSIWIHPLFGLPCLFFSSQHTEKQSETIHSTAIKSQFR
eukprot:TRINITY_DN1900_c0_g1_i1.p1 TRINITY_DN1900_c0_g1~~TRINITY_DN1900_c0_g1_i1.p1  ORF type:complete len:125 (+),score=7.98 TRINITY_DN1900_c0_g1_i1:1-375(+)